MLMFGCAKETMRYARNGHLPYRIARAVSRRTKARMVRWHCRSAHDELLVVSPGDISIVFRSSIGMLEL